MKLLLATVMLILSGSLACVAALWLSELPPVPTGHIAETFTVDHLQATMLLTVSALGMLSGLILTRDDV